MLKNEHFLDVRYYETDQMGIVHHSNYIRYFECARTVLLVDCGCPIETCEKEDGVTFPIVSLECRFRYPAKMGDVVTAVATVETLPTARLQIGQAVYNQDGVLCAEGKVVLGFLDKRTGRPVRCPERILRCFEEHING